MFVKELGKITFTKKNLICGLLIFSVASLALSSEKLIIRYSNSGRIGFVLENSVEPDSQQCCGSTCCSVAMHCDSNHLFSVHTEILHTTRNKLECCVDLPFGGGIPDSELSGQVYYSIGNVSHSINNKYNIPLSNSIRVLENYPYPNGPPGHVDTIVLRI